MSTRTLPDLLTPFEVARWLSLPVAQMERMARRKAIPAITLPGGELVFDPADLRAWLDGRRQAEEVVRV
jgi:hypothetical protein